MVPTTQPGPRVGAESVLETRFGLYLQSRIMRKKDRRTLAVLIVTDIH